MFATKGVFDGVVCVPDAETKLQPRVKAIITTLDEPAHTTPDLRRFVGAVSSEDSRLVEQAIDELRTVSSDH